MKRLAIHGLVAGILSGIGSVIYMKLYEEFFYVSFDQIVSIGAIFGSCIIGCLLMAMGYMLLEKFKKQKLKGTLNLLICTLSFASIMGPIMMSLPFDVEFPELFPGLVIPMHFLPALAFMALQPFFKEKNKYNY